MSPLEGTRPTSVLALPAHSTGPPHGERHKKRPAEPLEGTRTSMEMWGT